MCRVWCPLREIRSHSYLFGRPQPRTRDIGNSCQRLVTPMREGACHFMTILSFSSFRPTTNLLFKKPRSSRFVRGRDHLGDNLFRSFQPATLVQQPRPSYSGQTMEG
jgi:hypothetical protein